MAAVRAMRFLTTHFLITAAPVPVAAPEPEPELEAAMTPATSPDEYICPISHELMVDPVFTASGQTYERECIVHVAPGQADRPDLQRQAAEQEQGSWCRTSRFGG